MDLDDRDRGRSAGAGDLHADGGLPARVRRVRGEDAAEVRRELSLDRAHFDWPFFDAMHRALAAEADRWAIGAVQRLKVEAELRRSNDDATSDRLSGSQRRRGLPAPRRFARRRRPAAALRSGALRRRFAALDSRALCVVRETLAWHDGLADFAFAMQGLGSRADRAGSRSGRPSRRRTGSPKWRTAGRSRRSRCPSPTRAPMSRR